MNGTVKKLFLDKGFGFISPGEGQPDLFFHITDMRVRAMFSELQIGQAVSYDPKQHEKGLRATNVAAAT